MGREDANGARRDGSLVVAQMTGVQPRRLPSREASTRWWNEPLRSAAKERLYERTATRDELEADLAVLRALVARARAR